MQKEWSVYRADSGDFTGVILSVHDSLLEQNTPAGCKLMEGRFDPRRHRVTAASAVIEIETPAVDEAAIFHAQYARAEIARLEAAQHRAIREATLGYDGAAGRLKALDEQIQALRQKL